MTAKFSQRMTWTGIPLEVLPEDAASGTRDMVYHLNLASDSTPDQITAARILVLQILRGKSGIARVIFRDPGLWHRIIPKNVPPRTFSVYVSKAEGSIRHVNAALETLRTAFTKANISGWKMTADLESDETFPDRTAPARGPGLGDNHNGIALITWSSDEGHVPLEKLSWPDLAAVTQSDIPAIRDRAAAEAADDTAIKSAPLPVLDFHKNASAEAVSARLSQLKPGILKVFETCFFRLANLRSAASLQPFVHDPSRPNHPERLTDQKALALLRDAKLHIEPMAGINTILGDGRIPQVLQAAISIVTCLGLFPMPDAGRDLLKSYVLTAQIPEGRGQLVLHALLTLGFHPRLAKNNVVYIESPNTGLALQALRAMQKDPDAFIRDFCAGEGLFLNLPLPIKAASSSVPPPTRLIPSVAGPGPVREGSSPAPGTAAADHVPAP
ncbi:MAG: hypothetical protein M3O22_07075 [Pseudomonadota bacterium]|nr:hypothetical protein [Pseudomonadota bacterium]